MKSNPFPGVPSKPGMVVTAASYAWDRDRKRWRITQACYEPREKARKSTASAAPKRGRAGLVSTERQGKLL